MGKPRKLSGPVRARLHRQLAQGWQRAVFASPRNSAGERDEEVVPGPGIVEPDAFEGAFINLLDAAERAAAAGRVKQTFVLDDRRRLELDVRHGQINQRTLDDETIDKIMAGKDRTLRPDRSAALLRAIGIMNADGTISARNAKKYKQVDHLVEVCRPTWARLARAGRSGPLRIVDLACGNSYLGLVLLESLRLVDLPARLVGIDRRGDVIDTSRARAEQIGFGDRSEFRALELEELDGPSLIELAGGPVDIVLSLHACDTATDAALGLALAADAAAILAVPCCQAELARQLAGARSLAESIVPALVEAPLLRREFGALLTDALRVEVLEALGHDVAVVEFVDSSHTPKNLLIRALRARRPDAKALARVAERCRALGVWPNLLDRVGLARD